MQGIASRLLIVTLWLILSTTACSFTARPSPDGPTAEDVAPTRQPRPLPEAILGSWTKEADNQHTTYTFLANGTVRLTHHSTTLLAGRPITGRRDLTGRYRLEKGSQLTLHLKGTIFNSVEGTRQMEVTEQFEVAVVDNLLALKHRESDEAVVFTQVPR